MDVLRSAEDASVNFVERLFDGGAFESRYVRRVPEYFIAYLSSHSGCNQACRFCHLTQMRQIMMTPATLTDYREQAERVLNHYAQEGMAPAEWVNFNFMARGEPLLNGEVVRRWPALYDALRQQAAEQGLMARFNVSTIFPRDAGDIDLLDVFPRGSREQVTLYYSLYSMDKTFRKRWLPHAMHPVAALRRLHRWQQVTGNDVVLHWAFIDGENDDQDTIEHIIAFIAELGLRVRFNLVRYNPYSARQGVESDEQVLGWNFSRLSEAFGDTGSRIVPRVGFDVKASCGMFA